MQQQQASDDEIYEILNNMYDDIGFILNLYEDTIIPFENTSAAGPLYLLIPADQPYYLPDHPPPSYITPQKEGVTIYTNYVIVWR